MAADSAATAPPPSTRRRYTLGGYPVDAVCHPEFAAAVPHDGWAVLVEHRLVVAVHRDVVDDVVGHDHVRGALHGDRPAGSERGDLIAGPDHDQRRVVAV